MSLITHSRALKSFQRKKKQSQKCIAHEQVLNKWQTSTNEYERVRTSDEWVTNGQTSDKRVTNEWQMSDKRVQMSDERVRTSDEQVRTSDERVRMIEEQLV
jgi:hypothetical protein